MSMDASSWAQCLHGTGTETSMPSPIALLAASLLAFAPPALLPTLTAAVASQDPVFRGSIDMVTLNVAVTDHSGHYVGDLQSSDFSVLDDGRPQPIAYFQPTDVPLVT